MEDRNFENTVQGSHQPKFKLSIFTGAILTFLLIFNSFGWALTDPVINEFVLNHTGTDTNEYVEIYGDPNTDYSALTILQIEGDSTGAGIIDSVFPVGMTDTNGFWFTGFLNNLLENGTVTLFLVEGFSGSLGADLDTDNDGVLDSEPWSSLVDSVGVADGGSSDLTYSSVVLALGFDGVSFTPGGASRIPDGTDTDSVSDWVRNDFDGAGIPGFTGTPDINEALNTPGAMNQLVAPLLLSIMQIQGAGHKSPYESQIVSTEGIVTVVSSNGFYMQDPAGDDDIATSDGIFVFTSSDPWVAVGDSLEVQGTVNEFYPGGISTGNLSTTELTSPTITILSTGNTLPSPIILGNGGRIPPSMVIENDATGDVETTGTFDPEEDGIDFYESLEGMLVQVNDALVIGSNSFGEIAVLGDGGINATNLTLRSGLIMQADDFNPERIIIDDALVNDEPIVNVGDVFSAPVVGVIDYSFGNFKLLNPDPLPSVISGGLIDETTTLTGSPTRLTVASMNMGNLDPNPNDGDDDTTRLLELGNQIVYNMQSPDIICVQEIQDNNGSTDDGEVDASDTYNALISAIVAAGGPSYEYRDIAPENNEDGGQPGGNIRAGFIFQPDRVTFVDRPGGDATTPTSIVLGGSGAELSYSPGRIDPNNSAFIESRKPLVGEFLFSGERIFVVVVHFNSKGGDDPLFGRIQPPVFYSETQRIQQAQVVNDFVKSILALDSNANVIVAGDTNDFQFSFSLETLAGEELTNLVDSLPNIEQYNYIFDGNSQILDNYLISDNLLNSTDPEFDIVHANAEFHSSSRPIDHDPLVARFCMDSIPPELKVSVTPETLWPPNHKYREVIATVEVSDNADPNVGLTLLSVTSNEPDNGRGDGNTTNDILIVNDFKFKLRAERSGKGNGRTYTITYEATDDCGNSTIESAKVKVPHDKGKKKEKKVKKVKTKKGKNKK